MSLTLRVATIRDVARRRGVPFHRRESSKLELASPRTRTHRCRPCQSCTVRCMRPQNGGLSGRLDLVSDDVEALTRLEQNVDGVTVAVWNHSQASVFGSVPTHRVCQAWFGRTIGPEGLYGEARRSVDQRLKSLLGNGRWHVIDRRPTRWAAAPSPVRPPRYFALTATDPDQVRYWLSDDRVDALTSTVATTLTPFDLRLFARPRSRIGATVVRNLVDTARRLM